VYFVGYLYIFYLIDARKMEYIKMPFKCSSF